MKRRSMVGAVVGALALTLVVMTAGAAGADPSPVTVDIRAGNNGDVVGSATFTRTADGDGTETLTVDLSVPGGITEDHLCLSDSAFTSRIPPGQCAYGHSAVNNTTDQFVVDLGATYVGETLYAQLHVATAGETAYAGWQPGSPFYGNVAIDTTSVQGVPSAPLLGSFMPVGLALLFLAGMGAVVWVRRRQFGSALSGR